MTNRINGGHGFVVIAILVCISLTACYEVPKGSQPITHPTKVQDSPSIRQQLDSSYSEILRLDDEIDSGYMALHDWLLKKGPRSNWSKADIENFTEGTACGEQMQKDKHVLISQYNSLTSEVDSRVFEDGSLPRRIEDNQENTSEEQADSSARSN